MLPKTKSQVPLVMNRRNRKSVAMKTLVAEIAKKAITYKFSGH